MTLCATTGVPDHEAGLTAGLINTTRQVGGALGLAVIATAVSSIAASHEAGHHSIDSALASGDQAAFVIAGRGLIIGTLLASLLPKLRAPTPTAPRTSHEEPAAVHTKTGAVVTLHK